MELSGELRHVFFRVRADSENGDLCPVVVSERIAEGAGFGGAARRVGAGIEIEDDDMAAFVVVEGNGLSLARGNLNFGADRPTAIAALGCDMVRLPRVSVRRLLSSQLLANQCIGLAGSTRPPWAFIEVPMAWPTCFSVKVFWRETRQRAERFLLWKLF